MSLTDAQRAVLEARLAEAEAALHALYTGEAVTEVQYDDKRVRKAVYEKSTGELESYIAQLRAQLAGKRRRGALSVRWGG